MTYAHTRPIAVVTYDPLTLVALSCVAYVLAIFLHEGAGHALSCVTLGGHLKSMGAFYVDCDTHQMSDLASRMVAASGVMMNGLVALLSYRLLLWSSHAQARFFLWLVMAVSVLDGAGYLMFSGFSGLGDFGHGPSGFFAGELRFWPYQVALSTLGIALYFLAALVLARALRHVVAPAVTAAQIARILCVAYLSGGILALLVGLMNPYGWEIVLGSAAASTLGGTSGLLWLGYFHLNGLGNLPEFKVPRNWPVVLACSGLLVVYVVLFGAGMNF